MIQLTRRSLLTGAAAATAIAPLAASLPARAAAPPAGAQAPGWYRYKVGSFEVTVVAGCMIGSAGPSADELPTLQIEELSIEDLIDIKTIPPSEDKQ